MTTPRQPAKRAKGRAHTLYMEPTYREQKGFVNTWAYQTTKYGNPVVPVAVINLAEYDQAVERMARAIHREVKPLLFDNWKRTPKCWKVEYRKEATMCLKAIGIAAPRKERKTL